MSVDGKKEFIKLCLPLKRGILSLVLVMISSCIICFAKATKYSKEIPWRLTFKYFEKVAEFSIPLSFTE